MTTATRLYSVDETADRLGVGKRKVEELVRDGAIESVLIGRRRLVPDVAVSDYIERLRRAS